MNNRIMALQREVTDAEEKLKRLDHLVENGLTDLDDVLKDRLTAGSVPFRKAYLQSLIDVVEVDDHQVRAKGSKEVLERAVPAGQAAETGSQMSTRWRARRDSNSRPPDS